MKPCSDCPFRVDVPRDCSRGWVDLLVQSAEADPEIVGHTCHRTDPLADGYKGAKGELEMCAGWAQMKQNLRDGTPGLGGVYPSVAAIADAYADEIDIIVR